MMAANHIEFPASELAKDITINIHVTGLKTYRIRLMLASLFFRIGAWIAGVGLEWQEEER